MEQRAELSNEQWREDDEVFVWFLVGDVVEEDAVLDVEGMGQGRIGRLGLGEGWRWTEEMGL
ncbi:hypothetical protein E2562_008433 [Oryza meyeriana var. granulata]|uniref:Uncharacterized protein n=1 Tax=Oryza meyeriana var. granulata TaxID=110450 RepID=A0A6G1EHP8_9ORYZ|nr:hypothetical protein E2562_008433 [Oryza meyeriana var. granulata]